MDIPYRGTVTFQTAPIPFTRSDARKLGLTPHLLQTRTRYSQVYRGVWIDEQPETQVPTPSWSDRQWLSESIKLQACRLLRPDVIGTLWTAARLYGLPVPNRIVDDRLHVAAPVGATTIVRPWIQLHRIRDLESSTFFMLPLHSVPQLLIELAPLLTVEELVVIGDAVLSHQRSGPFSTLDALTTAVEQRKQIRGRKTLQKAYSLIRGNVDSPKETWLRLWIIAQGFPEPVVHPPIDCELGSVTLHPDLGYPNLRLAIEYEGDHHRTSANQFAIDIERRQMLEAAGWTVLRVSKRTDMARFRKLLAGHLANSRL